MDMDMSLCPGRYLGRRLLLRSQFSEKRTKIQSYKPNFQLGVLVLMHKVVCCASLPSIPDRQSLYPVLRL